jgi:hypothetical protein
VTTAGSTATTIAANVVTPAMTTFNNPSSLGNPDRSGIISGAVTAATVSQEFDGADPLTWVAAGGGASNPTAKDCNTTVPNAYFVSSVVTTRHYGMLAAAPGTTADVRCKINGGTSTGLTPSCFWGLIISDTNVNNGILILFTPGTGIQMYYMSATALTQVGSSITGYSSPPLYYRIQLTGGNFTAAFSSDGVNYIDLATTNAVSFTIAKAGLAVLGTVTNPVKVVSEWLRVHSSVVYP